ncbi:MAG: A24 family peptidase [Rickettsiales bacterium]|jgi:leader peptidase (prepilin peptidase)/N-methyltransferase|nr:A24 family peptidase [Rickettsiales bacterium]
MLTTAYIISIISVAAIAVEDARRRLIPDVWLWPLLLAGLYVSGGTDENVAAAILGYAVGFALMWALRKKEALGYGDVKLLAVAGLWLGVNGLSFAVVSACMLGVAWGLARKQRYVPFAPFLFLGTAAYYLTKEILLWRI